VARSGDLATPEAVLFGAGLPALPRRTILILIPAWGVFPEEEHGSLPLKPTEIDLIGTGVGD
jgi:hypothetical protein